MQRLQAARPRAGITLMEMLVVVTLISLLAAVTFPSVTAGVDTLRLTSASDSIVSFLNAALNRAERRQQVMEVTISQQDNSMTLRSTEPGYTKQFVMPEGVSIAAVHPRLADDMLPRHIMLYPGGVPPRVGIEIVNRKNDRRLVRIDPTTGVSQVERIAAGQEVK